MLAILVKHRQSFAAGGWQNLLWPEATAIRKIQRAYLLQESHSSWKELSKKTGKNCLTNSYDTKGFYIKISSPS